MTTEERATLAEAVDSPVVDYPTVTAAMACMEPECGAIFRAGDSCPYCSNRSLLNLAAVLTPRPCLACGMAASECGTAKGACCATCEHERAEAS